MLKTLKGSFRKLVHHGSSKDLLEKTDGGAAAAAAAQKPPSIKEMKKALTAAGVPIAGIAEKAELVALYNKHCAGAGAAAQRTRTRSVAAANPDRRRSLLLLPKGDPDVMDGGDRSEKNPAATAAVAAGSGRRASRLGSLRKLQAQREKAARGGGGGGPSPPDGFGPGSFRRPRGESLSKKDVAAFNRRKRDQLRHPSGRKTPTRSPRNSGHSAHSHGSRGSSHGSRGSRGSGRKSPARSGGSRTPTGPPSPVPVPPGGRRGSRLGDLRRLQAAARQRRASHAAAARHVSPPPHVAIARSLK